MTASDAAGQLRAFIAGIDTEFTTRRGDLRRRWDDADNLPLYPTDASLPTTTVGTVRAVLADRDRLAARVAELEAKPRPYLTKAIAEITPELEAKLRAAFAAAVEAVPYPADCDCDCQPGQPCLCPERDCYCGPCPVCGPHPAETEAPLCGHCGERNRDGSYNEHDRSWQCAPCHMAAARGETR